ncbi:BadF/BadG/BcrA/BcrD ATPase family protein [Streptomyces sp. NPDC059398]|uniref:BadF/BadG/BcrA/BcrD ATPase family protein n=1 Tax=Streptomyces sp. NPDC059398 TaxID=3346820 RepID=UPI003679C73A
MYLGVDGGGTKTAFCLLDPAGTVRGQAGGPPLSPALGPGGTRTAARVLREGVAEVCRQAGTDTARLRYAFLGLPGHGESAALTAALDALPAQVLGSVRHAVGNDMVCGWAGSLGLADGINVISGTGSMAYGELRGGRARTGGWGELFGDEGSGHWLAVRGLNLFTRMSDGRMPPGPLHGLLRRRLTLDDDLDLVGTVLMAGWDRTAVASLSRCVTEAAGAGDTACTALLAEAGGELAALARAARGALGADPGERVPVSWSGGVLAVPQVREAFTAALDASPEPFAPRPPRTTPVIGAALMAARLAAEPLSAETVNRLPAPADPGGDSPGSP